MSYRETRDAINQALTDIEYNQMAIDELSSAMAKALVGRLRLLEGYQDGDVLIALKKELADYNMTTRQWKSK